MELPLWIIAIASVCTWWAIAGVTAELRLTRGGKDLDEIIKVMQAIEMSHRETLGKVRDDLLRIEQELQRR